jgi:hypothetical protein
MEETIKVMNKFIILYFDSYGTIFDRREVLGLSLREVFESITSEVDFEYEFSVGKINMECDTLDWLNDDERIIIVGV